MNIVIIDGQGGRLGSLLCEELKRTLPTLFLTAVGTNTLATAAMLKAGADAGATGENPVLVAAREADLILGPLGIVTADALLGEVTPAMAVAIGQSHAIKLLLPMNRCRARVVGARSLPLGDLVKEACREVQEILEGK